jgi:hypothetical protein
MPFAPVAVQFPDAEALAINWLAQQLKGTNDAAVVGQLRPNPMPRRFVTVMRTGGVVELSGLADGAQLTVDCWSQDRTSAYQLAQACRYHLHALRGTVTYGTTVIRVEDVGGPALLPYPDATYLVRYEFTVVLTVRGSAPA